MNQKQVLINLAAIANVLDERKAYVYANQVTQVMKRVAQFAPKKPIFPNLIMNLMTTRTTNMKNHLVEHHLVNL